MFELYNYLFESNNNAGMKAIYLCVIKFMNEAKLITIK